MNRLNILGFILKPRASPVLLSSMGPERFQFCFSFLGSIKPSNYFNRKKRSTAGSSETRCWSSQRRPLFRGEPFFARHRSVNGFRSLVNHVVCERLDALVSWRVFRITVSRSVYLLQRFAVTLRDAWMFSLPRPLGARMAIVPVWLWTPMLSL